MNNEPVGDAFTIAFDSNGKATHSLKDGETLYIRGFERGLGIPGQRAAYDWFRPDSSRGEQ